MLSHLSINDFAIVENLELELSNGMTVVSGETGAGKSIMLDALGLALGNRADSGEVRNGAERAEVIATFDLDDAPDAKAWLAEQDLDTGNECILRRIITKEGRSRCYINGRPNPINNIKSLRSLLIDIHGQHEHQRLLNSEHHRVLLDGFSQSDKLVQQTRQAFKSWQHINKQLQDVQNHSQEHDAHMQLLRYQVDELRELAPISGEVEQLEQEQRQLESASDILSTGHQVLDMASGSDQGNCLSLINHCQQLLINLGEHKGLEQVSELFNSAHIQIEEANSELNRYLDKVEVNPERLIEVENRLSALYDMARKHKLQVKELPQFLAERSAELIAFESTSSNIETLQAEANASYEKCLATAKKLTHARTKAANKLSKEVNKHLHLLGMLGAELTVSLSPLDLATQHGLENIEFLVSTNKGQPPRPLGKVASGGELSRISLAIQVITAASCATPTLIFDEVDVGIGGAIAEVVGKLMRQLGENSQILCVTHQPQVASQGHNHLFVSKRATSKATHTQITRLKSDSRVQEIARMLGGIEITNRSLEHAREMLGEI